MSSELVASRPRLVRAGRMLVWFWILWNGVFCGMSIIAGLSGGSVALLSFGISQLVQVIAGGAVVWRLSRDDEGQVRARSAERLAARLVAASFPALAAVIAVLLAGHLVMGMRPQFGPVGFILAFPSLFLVAGLTMKRFVATLLRSQALLAEVAGSALSVRLSLILCAGLAVHGISGWWWADPLATLAMLIFTVSAAVSIRRAGRSSRTPGTLRPRRDRGPSTRHRVGTHMPGPSNLTGR